MVKTEKISNIHCGNVSKMLKHKANGLAAALQADKTNIIRHFGRSTTKPDLHHYQQWWVG